MAERARFAGTIAGLTIALLLAGRAGTPFAVVNAAVSPISPAAGIAVAALLVAGFRVWPAVAVAAFATYLDALRQPAAAAVLAAGDTLGALVAAILAIRVARGRSAFQHAADVFRFALVAALIAPLLPATIGTVMLRASALAGPADTQFVWLMLWLGHAVGVALVAPLGILLMQPGVDRQAGRVELLALGAALVLVLYAVFGVPETLQRDIPLAVLMLPLMLWSAFRVDARTTAALSLIMAVIGVYRIVLQYGPFNLGSPAVAVLMAQVLVAIVSLLMLAVAAETAMRRHVEAEIRQLNEALERRVGERTAELSRAHDRLLEAQSVARIGSFEWDVATNALRWTDELCRIFGVAAAPPDYSAYLTFVHRDDRERTDRELRRAARTGRPFSIEQRIIRADGEERVVQIQGRVELDAQGGVRRVLGIGHDLTERLRAEQARAQLRDEQARRHESEEVNRAKDAFLATLSHELRTPLNAALGWTHILRESMHADAREARIVKAIYRNLHLQARIVNDILDISRIAKGELPLEWEEVELRAVFEAAIDMLREAATARGLQVEVRCSGTPVVVGDSRRLQQVAWNLLSNAIKFCAEGGRVTVNIVEDADSGQCTVEDEGPGITPAFLPHVFEQFSQADSSATREYGGLGLGLAIAREIVAMHDGTIVAGNRPGGGAAFVVRLPKRRAVAARVPLPRAEPGRRENA